MARSGERTTGIYDYTGVPLDPMNALYPLGSDAQTGRPYYTASFEHIHDVLLANLPLIEARGLFGTEQLNTFLRYVDDSLADAHARRMYYNYSRPLPPDVDLTDPVVQETLIGNASADQRIAVLLSYPSLQAIELAKLSHPFDIDAVKPMEQDVTRAIVEEAGGVVLLEPEKVRHKIKSYMQDSGKCPDAFSIVRKSVVGIISTEHGIIEIVKRSSFIVADNHTSRHANEIFEGSNNGKAKQAVYDAIEERIAAGDIDTCDWLFPTTTSFYAKYVTE